MENKNDMIGIHDKEVNKIAEYNFLHDIINPPKCTKQRMHYSLILQGFMNTRKGKAKFKTFESYCTVGVVP